MEKEELSQYSFQSSFIEEVDVCNKNGTCDEGETFNNCPLDCDGLAAHWSFDAGDAKDDSGNGNDGDVFGATFISGIKGQAASFDGEDDYIEIPDTNASYDIDFSNIDSWTVSLWAKSDMLGYSSSAYLVGVWRTGSSERSWAIRVSSANNESNLLMSNSGASAEYSFNSNVTISNEWQHLVVTFDNLNDSIYFYVDGELTSSDICTDTPNDNEANLWIGGLANILNFNGSIDEVKMWDHALSEEEVIEEYIEVSCGNDVCESSETMDNCPIDCGSEFKYNISKLNESINISIQINGSTQLNNSYKKNKIIKISHKGNNLIRFSHNFSERKLDLRNLSIIKNISENKTHILISGLNATETKKIYLDKNQSSSNAVCVLDEDVDNLTYLNNNCHRFSCPGSYGSITCVIENNTFVVSNLQHSGVIEDYIEPSAPPNGGRGGGGSPKRQENITEECTERWVCDNWKPEVCPENGIQTRSCEEVNECGTEIQKPVMTRTCEYFNQIEEEIIVNEELLAPEENTNYFWIYLTLALIILGVGGAGFVFYKKHKALDLEKQQTMLKDPSLQRLEDYIKKTLVMGYTKEQIRNALLRRGWKEEIVDYMFRKIGR